MRVEQENLEGSGIDTATIDQRYAQLQNASQQVYQDLRDLAAKLQSESGGLNQQARKWVLDSAWTTI